MNPILILACFLSLCALPTGWTAANYIDSLKAGDTAMDSGKADLALEEFEAAVGHGVTEGEKAFARAKKAFVLSFKKKDYAAARKEVDELAKSLATLSPVAQLTVLQVLAECQMRADRNFVGATENLEKALALPDVDFARPYLNLNLADCYRETGEFSKSLEASQRVLDAAGVSSQTQASARFSMGQTYQYGLKDFEKAKQAYAEAVKLNPGLKGSADSESAKMP
jgi:tetratricopeptide (TPR) repeat protein